MEKSWASMENHGFCNWNRGHNSTLVILEFEMQPTSTCMVTNGYKGFSLLFIATLLNQAWQRFVLLLDHSSFPKVWHPVSTGSFASHYTLPLVKSKLHTSFGQKQITHLLWSKANLLAGTFFAPVESSVPPLWNSLFSTVSSSHSIPELLACLCNRTHY